MTKTPQSKFWLRRLLSVVVLLLGIKVLASILWEYRRYFPPDFTSEFLTGRESHFWGLYSDVFYLHIVAGPLAVLLAATLLATGIYGQNLGTTRFVHKLSGHLLWPIVIVVIMPTGLLMATRAFAGPVAGVAFALLSLFTGATAIQAVRFARKHNFAQHRRWATRCIVLLFSPLLLRLIGGFLSLLPLNSPVYYQINAWISWVLPLLAVELFFVRRRSWQSESASKPVSHPQSLVNA